MKIETASRLLPFSCEQTFELAADIERYPEFLPGWISAQIRRREDNVLYVEQVLGVGPTRIQFSSKAVLTRPHRIDVISSEPPFRCFNLTWLIAQRSGTSCAISVTIDVEFESRLLQHIAYAVLAASIEDAVAALEARANSLYAQEAAHS